MLLMLYKELSETHTAYIAGTQDGIVTVDGLPSRRDVVVMKADDLSIVEQTQSLKNGHYLLMGLDPNKHYLIMCRDYNRDYEPCVYDHVQPATDLTIAEQVELWNSWQNS